LTDPFSQTRAGHVLGVNLRKVIRKRIQESRDGVNVAGSIDAVIAANVNEPGTTSTHVSSNTRIVQRDGRTEVFETEPDLKTKEEGNE
jgi:hypothetical protein